MNEQKIFDNAAFIKVEGPSMAGWHKCQLKELLGNSDETYTDQFEGELLKWVGAPLPKDQMADVLALVKEYPHTEVHVCLYYNVKESKWHFHVPNQRGSGAHVDYNDEEYIPPKGYYFTGTIHTHPNLGAFWSSIDVNDQKDKTGLHVVLGLREGVLEDYKVVLVYNGARYDQDKALVELPDPNNLPEPKKEWLDLVEERWYSSEQLSAPSDSSYSVIQSNSSKWKSIRLDDDYWEDPDGQIWKSSEEGEEDDLNQIVEDIVYECTEEEVYSLVQRLLIELGEEELSERVGEASLRFREESDSAV